MSDELRLLHCHIINWSCSWHEQKRSMLQIKNEMRVWVCVCVREHVGGWVKEHHYSASSLWIHLAVTQYAPPGTGLTHCEFVHASSFLSDPCGLFYTDSQRWSYLIFTCSSCLSANIMAEFHEGRMQILFSPRGKFKWGRGSMQCSKFYEKRSLLTSDLCVKN